MIRFWPFRKFSRDERGSASVFAICLIPMFLALGGLAIDGANAWRVRTIMQATADSAALAAVMDLPNIATVNLRAQTYAAKNMPVASNGNVLATTDVLTGNWDSNARTFSPNTLPINAVQVIVKRSAANSNSLPTTFLSLIGHNNWDIVTTAIATNDTHKLWVSLVLDNTGSMCQPGPDNPCPTPVAGSKIAVLKTATHQVLTKLQNASSTPGDVQVAIVPFTKDVNVGTANVNASWLDWTDWEAAPANGAPSSNVGPGSSCPYSTSTQGYACQSTPTNASSTITTIPSSGSFKGYICPSQDNGAANSNRIGHYYNGCWTSTGTHAPYTHTWIANAHSTWGGCVMDRAQNDDVRNTAPAVGTKFPAENAQSCVSSVLGGLGYNWTALNSQVDAMAAQGSTNQTIGLAWGWQAMTQGSPLNAPVPPANTRQVIVLLSDGFNTQDRWYGNGYDQNTSVDSRMATACSNAKAAGVTIYTVFVDINGTQGNSSVLQSCASDANKYFDLTSAGQIITTLDKIAQQITYHRVVF